MQQRSHVSIQRTRHLYDGYLIQSVATFSVSSFSSHATPLQIFKIMMLLAWVFLPLVGAFRITPVRRVNTVVLWARPPLRRPIRQSSGEENLPPPDVVLVPSQEDAELWTSTHFADHNLATKRAIAQLGMDNMTEIQAETWAVARAGASVLGSSPTGTGKTIAFLLPALERLLAKETSYRPGRNVGILIVAPTRELVIQIGEDAKALLAFHSDYNVLCSYGGTKIHGEILQLSKRIPTVLVATPGRLLDHLNDTRLQGGRKFEDIMGETPILVLDEADRLIEAFQKETKKILSHLPRSSKRQTLLFSATLPKRLKAVLDTVLPPDYERIDCTLHENTLIEQSYLSLPSMDLYVSALVSIVRQISTEDYYKIAVFFPTAKLVKFFCDLFRHLGIPTLEMHSRMSQGSRNRVRDEFGKRESKILFTSDVSARGVDYPDVTHVIQYGTPCDRETGYLHRLGRTGRIGKQGKGLLVALPFESNVLARIKKRVRLYHETTQFDNLRDEGSQLDSWRQMIRDGNPLIASHVEGAYSSFVAFYLEYADRSVAGDTVLEAAEAFAQSAGLATLPDLPEILAGKVKRR
jgi:ATP-dependent RNA helicase MSS116